MCGLCSSSSIGILWGWMEKQEKTVEKRLIKRLGHKHEGTLTFMLSPPCERVVECLEVEVLEVGVAFKAVKDICLLPGTASEWENTEAFKFSALLA